MARANLPRRVRHVLQQLFSLVSDKYAAGLERLLDELEQELVRLAQERTSALHASYVDTLDRLRQHRADLVPHFLVGLEAALAQIRDGAARERGAVPIVPHDFSSLRLVDEHEVDEDAALRMICVRHESRGSLPLLLIGQRFGVLAGAPAFDVERLPVGPRGLSRILAKAARSLHINLDTRLLLYRLFDRHLSTNYVPLLEAMNLLLIRENVLPGLSYVPLRTRPATPRSDDPVAAAAGAHGSERAGQAATGSASTVQAFTGWPAIADRDPAGGEAAGLSREDSDTFELLGLLYSCISREMRDDAPSVVLLERLQLPLLRLALQDRGFFTRKQHPARQLLNAVAESGARWTGDEEVDPQLQQQLNSVVEQVVEQYDGDTAVFEAANQSLQQHLRKMARKAEVTERRHVDAARGKDKLELAKRRALAVVEAAIGDLRLARFLHTLLLQAWADVLTLVLLRHGEDSEQWRQHEAATRQIVDFGARGQTPPDELVRLIQEGLGLVGYQGEEAASIARRMTSAEDAADDPVSRTELAMKIKMRARLGAETESLQAVAAPRNAQEQEYYQQLRSLPFGSWIELVTNQQGDMVRRRLAWFSLATDRVLLVNQRGQRVDEQSLDHIARLMAIDQARIVTPDRASLVDRAWSTALGSLRKLTKRGGTA